MFFGVKTKQKFNPTQYFNQSYFDDFTAAYDKDIANNYT